MMLTLIAIVHIIGAITSIQAIMNARTAQGATAWFISLNTFPLVAVVAYWIFGQTKFDGYDLIRHSKMLADSIDTKLTMKILEQNEMLVQEASEREALQIRLHENLALFPLTRHNDVKLLVNGKATFDAIFAAIEQAKKYIFVEFYIIRDDTLGNRLKDALIAKAADGIDVFVLYDDVGSIHLSRAYLDDLEAAGVKTSGFTTTRGFGNRLRLNFRNHRKIVVVDGDVAFIGGHNVGDEYLGHHPKLSPWRDTHVQISGPVVLEAQLTFVEDWHWASEDQLPLLNWAPRKSPGGDVVALCLPTGPADQLESATLFFLNAISSATQQVWIASPYFVPDVQLISALQLAALRGVDVRILLPEINDQTLVYLSSFSYLEELEKAGIKVYRYQSGFLHQKVVLVDQQVATIGTANFDNRSMRLNFEITVMTVDHTFALEVEKMLADDFSNSKPVTAADFTEKSFFFRLIVRLARLLAPIQ